MTRSVKASVLVAAKQSARRRMKQPDCANVQKIEGYNASDKNKGVWEAICRHRSQKRTEREQKCEQDCSSSAVESPVQL
jgi:hypothetical protein